MEDSYKYEKLKQLTASLKEDLALQRKTKENIESLINKSIQHHYPVNLWEFSETELDKEMGRRLTFMNDDIIYLPELRITSHRKLIGFFIVFFKKTILRFLYKLFLKDLMDLTERQTRFNESAVVFKLASFIRFRQMEKKLNELEKKIEEIEEEKEIIKEASESMPGKSKKNEKEHHK